jgi:glycosyltransferase involved in cell wall biosynthesis
VAIPYRATDVMLGLTELNDALALAKPVVMTRSPHIDVDIEAVGCGIWVDPGDLGGWRRALTRLREHPDEAQAMGAAGRRFAQESWNAQTFERDVRAAVRPLVPDL